MKSTTHWQGRKKHTHLKQTKKTFNFIVLNGLNFINDHKEHSTSVFDKILLAPGARDKIRTNPRFEQTFDSEFLASASRIFRGKILPV